MAKWEVRVSVREIAREGIRVRWRESVPERGGRE